MRKNRIFVMVTMLILFYFIFTVTVIARNWCRLKYDFYNISFVDVSQLFIILILGSYLTYYLGQKGSREFRRIEILIGMVDDILSLLRDSYVSWASYKKDRREEDRVDLLKIMTHLSTQVALVSELKQKIKTSEFKNLDDRELVNLYLEYKKLVTGDHFGGKADYPEAHIDLVDRKYKEMIAKINKCKFELLG